MDASPGRRHQLDALADPTRRAILELLRERPLTAGEIAARFSQQRPAISKHLTLLRTTGWLAESRDRQRRIYSLRNDAVVVVADWARRLGEAIQATAGNARVSGPEQGRRAVGDGVVIEGRGSGEMARVAARDAANSNLRLQDAEAGREGEQSQQPASTDRSARASFELIFD